MDAVIAAAVTVLFWWMIGKVFDHKAPDHHIDAVIEYNKHGEIILKMKEPEAIADDEPPAARQVRRYHDYQKWRERTGSLQESI